MPWESSRGHERIEETVKRSRETKRSMRCHERAAEVMKGEGKAKKFGNPFIELISRYVDENDIIRPDDLVVKSTGANSINKLYIIQNI